MASATIDRVVKRRHAVRLLGASLLGAIFLLGGHHEREAAPPPTPPGPHQTAYWEGTIERFERRDAESAPRPGSVLFIGSSSVRMWKTLARDMEPLAVINRGFGGSEIRHSTHFADRIVAPYEPRGIVLYAGDNDMARHRDRGPEQVLEDVKAFVAAAEQAELRAPIYFVSIKPSLARMQHWPRMAEANRLVRELAEQHPRLRYLDVATPMLGPDGKPRPELFVEDGLHLNGEGYALWTRVIQPVLLDELGAPAS